MTIHAAEVYASGGGFSLGAYQAGVASVARFTRKLGGGDYALSVNGFGDTVAAPPEDWPTVSVPLVLGNPPCSGFSVRSPRRAIDAPVNDRMHELVAYAARVRPEVVVFECVQQAYRQGRQLMQQLRDQLEAGSGLEYHLTHVLHNALSHGGIAQRPRYFWVAHHVPFGVERGRVTRIGEPVELAHVPTLDDALSDLSSLPLTMEPQWRGPGTFNTWRAHEVCAPGYIDGHDRHRTPTTDRLATLLESGYDWPQGARASDSGFATSRWVADKPAKVATRDVAVEALHPYLPRNFTFREVARIMGFPDDWSVAGSFGMPHFNRGLGQGIPVQSGRWIARWARASIEGDPGSERGEPVGDRESLIDTTNDHKGLPDRS